MPIVIIDFITDDVEKEAHLIIRLSEAQIFSGLKLRFSF